MKNWNILLININSRLSKELARRLNAMKANVYIVGNKMEELEKITREEGLSQINFFQVNLDEEYCATDVQSVLKQLPLLHAVIHCPYFLNPTPLVETEITTMRKATNLMFSDQILMKACINKMIEQNAGVFLSISSIIANPKCCNFGISNLLKSHQKHLIEICSDELLQKNINNVFIRNLMLGQFEDIPKDKKRSKIDKIIKYIVEIMKNPSQYPNLICYLSQTEEKEHNLESTNIKLNQPSVFFN